ncbi:MAG: hypothetical protein J6A03_04795 [Lachnospiraceae bacterium]|nr:hypothetical protein [Lachnospiraceae bacterium]
MNNIELITQAAIAAGLYTAEQAESIVETNGCLPLHTFSFWKKKYGLVPKKGEHAILTTRLWKQKKHKKKQDRKDASENNAKEVDENSGYFLAKAFLFSFDQMQREEEEENI